MERKTYFGISFAFLPIVYPALPPLLLLLLLCAFHMCVVDDVQSQSILTIPITSLTDKIIIMC